MTPKERETFVKNFGFPVPATLEKLLEDQSLRDALPVSFRFTTVPFTLEIQYLSNLGDQGNYDIENKRFACAVSTDGHRILVDPSDRELKLMQSEFGDVDYLGITIQDLLDASRTEL